MVNFFQSKFHIFDRLHIYLYLVILKIFLPLIYSEIKYISNANFSHYLRRRQRSDRPACFSIAATVSSCLAEGLNRLWPTVNPPRYQGRPEEKMLRVTCPPPGLWRGNKAPPVSEYKFSSLVPKECFRNGWESLTFVILVICSRTLRGSVLATRIHPQEQ